MTVCVSCSCMHTTAWENMDLARALYSRIPNPDMPTRMALARVHDRLADLHHATGNTAGVVDELEQELEHVAIALPANCALQGRSCLDACSLICRLFQVP